MLGQFGVLAAALEPGVSDVAVAGMPVRVNVHTAESLAEPPAPPAVPEEPVAAAPDGQLSLFDAPPVVVAPAVDLPPPLEPLPAPAPHVPRALSYSALALHDRCGFSYYAQRVVGLRPPLAEAGPLRGALLGDALHRAVAVGVEDACAGLEPARSRRRGGPPRRLGGLLAGGPHGGGGSGAARAAVRVRRGRRRAQGLARHLRPQPRREPARGRSQDDERWRAASPPPWSRASTPLQRSIYALAALRSGAPAAEIAFCFLERPEAPVTRRFAPEDAERLAAEVRAAIGRLRASEFTARAGDHCATCPGARPPVPGSRLAWARGRVSRLNASSPPENRVRAILRRLRVAYPEARCSLDFTTPWELLVATILSAQCTDERVNMVTPGLFARYPDPQAFADADEGEIAKAIFQTGFHNQKARSLRGAALAVLERHGGKVPRSTEQLVRLPGVGRKTAAVVSGNAFGRREGIAVDTHVGRLSRRLGLTAETDPEKVERDLMAIVPAAGLGRVVAPPDLARPRRLHLARAALSRVRLCSICVPRARSVCLARRDPAHCVTDGARRRRT